MARAKKTETKTIETDLSMALDTPIEKTIESLATELQIDEFELRDRLCELVGNVAPLNWETLPLCHEPLLEEFKRGLEATASIRKLPEPEIPSIWEDEPQQSSAITESTPNELTSGINQDLQDTQRLNNETIELQELLYAAEADDKAQLAASVKQHGWQIYQRVGAEIDVNTILEIAQSKLNNADGATNSRLSALANQLNVRTPEQIRTATEERKQAFLQQQQARTAAWQSASTLQASKP